MLFYQMFISLNINFPQNMQQQPNADLKTDKSFSNPVLRYQSYETRK